MLLPSGLFIWSGLWIGYGLTRQLANHSIEDIDPYRVAFQVSCASHIFTSQFTSKRGRHFESALLIAHLCCFEISNWVNPLTCIHMLRLLPSPNFLTHTRRSAFSTLPSPSLLLINDFNHDLFKSPRNTTIKDRYRPPPP
jgi:hypothetical protein